MLINLSNNWHRNSTRSLYDTDIEYLDIHGRRYCADYYMPNDQDEQLRLQVVNNIFLHILGNKLTTVPLHNPQKILDIGTGTGEWAMDMGELYPEAEVTGTDIAKIQASAVPPNVFFEFDEAEEVGGWTWPENEFDLVHFRSMSGAFQDWSYMYKEAYKHLKPGGWVEIMDFDNFREFLDYFLDDEDVTNWFQALTDATAKSGRPRGNAHLQPQMLHAAGFTNVSVSSKTIPFGTWPEEKQERILGGQFALTQVSAVEALCLRPFTEQLGWSAEEVRRVCDIVVQSIRSLGLDPERSRGLSFGLKILVGKKPGRGDLDVPDDKSTMGDSTRTVTNGGG